MRLGDRRLLAGSDGGGRVGGAGASVGKLGFRGADLVERVIEISSTETAIKQIEIQAKFVEITQNNLKELSFDWLLGQSNFPKSNGVFLGGGTSGTDAAADGSGSGVRASDPILPAIGCGRAQRSAARETLASRWTIGWLRVSAEASASTPSSTSASTRSTPRTLASAFLKLARFSAGVTVEYSIRRVPSARRGGCRRSR